MELADPIRELAHDHHDLNELLVAIHEALTRVDRGQSKLEDELHEIGDGVEAFREALLDHFAREQEGLLPFVLRHLPGVSARVEALVLEHDRIADELTHLIKELSSASGGPVPLGGFRAALGRFEELYSVHTRSELAFLDEVATSLASDGAAAEQLRILLHA
jgi:hemerythrin-like domain-containing protein